MRMLRVSLALSLALGLAMPAAADAIDVLRQNTLTLTQQDGKVTTILVNEGQDMEQVNGAGVWAAGTWRLDEQRGFCWTARGETTVCIGLPTSAGVGDTWDVRGPTGQFVWLATIVEGRADLKALSR